MLVADNVDTVKDVGELEEWKSEEEAEREAVATAAAEREVAATAAAEREAATTAAAEREAATTAAVERAAADTAAARPTRPQRGLIDALPGAR